MRSELVSALVPELPTETWQEIVRALAQGRVDLVERLILGSQYEMSEEWGERFVRALGATYTSAANIELARVGSRTTIELFRKAAKPRDKNRFPAVPHDDAFIRRQAAKLVVGVSRDTRTAIREALIARYNNTKKPETLVRDLRNTIGLDPRRAKALRSFEDKLREQGVKGIDGKVERYRDALIRARAEAIARTESVAIENQARIEAWSIGLDSGAISEEAEMEWVSNGDPCEHCEDLDGERVPIGEMLESTHYGQVAHPPLHPTCYCMVVLKR
jgi:hypothetical protein